MMTPDELWDKYCHEDRRVDGGQYMMWDDFLAALAEYGELKKAEAVKVCRTMSHRNDDIGAIIAAAIEKMKLP